MKINIKNIIKDGYLMDKYANGSTKEQRIEGVPYISFPFELTDLSQEYKYLSWVFLDYDSNPVVQFSWIHWVVANYENTTNKVEENLLKSNKSFLKGINSYASPLANIKNPDIIHNYGGPTPPNGDHTYTLYVYAHNTPLQINDKFYLNELYTALKNVDYKKVEVDILSKG